MQVIYKIQSKRIKDRFYIGRTCRLKQRVYKHKTELNCGNHHSIKLQRHFNKYGEEDLEYTILETCTEENVLDREQYYIDMYTPYFNCYLSSFGREKGSIPWNKGKKLNYEVWNKGKKMKEDQRLNLIGHKVSIETRRKISESKKGHKQSIETVEKRNKSLFKKVAQFNLQGIKLAQYTSIKEASEITGCPAIGISVCCRNKQKTSAGFIWKFV